VWLGLCWGALFFGGVLYLTALPPGPERQRNTRDFILLTIVFAALTYILMLKGIIVLGA